MKTSNTKSRWLAIAAGIAATGGALTILCSDAIRTGHWELEHVLLPIVVGITIASGHLIGSALREWRILSAMGFAVLFALGTAATVYNSVGRQAATAETAAASAEHHNEAIEDTRRDLAQARADIAELERLALREQQGRPDRKGRPTTKIGCGTMCKGYLARKSETEAKAERLQSRLDNIGPAQVSSPKADRAAKVAALFGFEEERTKTVFHLVEPFLYALLFELAAIVAFGFGFAPARKVAKSVSKPETEKTTVSTPPPRGGRPQLVSNVHPLVAELRRGGPADSQDQLAQRMSLSKGEVSKQVKELGQLVSVTRNGRFNRIALSETEETRRLTG